jgi:integrase
VSVHKQDGAWRVRWRVGGKQRSRTFDRKADAVTFDAEARRRSRLGPALAAELDRSTITLDGFVQGSWRAHAATLSPASRLTYAWALEKHLGDLLDEPLAAIDVERLAVHQRNMLKAGATASTVRAVFIRLSGIMQIAVEHGHLHVNPARALRKVRADAIDEVQPLAPVELELLIASLNERDRVIVLLGGHLGLRPLEIRAIPWNALNGQTLTVGRAHTKAAARRTRTLQVPEITARELKEWRLQAGRPGNDQPIVGPMTANALKLWGAKRLRPAVRAATDGRIADATVYTLRHSHASALHYAGFTVPEAARRMGHGGELHLRVYAHCIDSISGERYANLDALLADARQRGNSEGTPGAIRGPLMPHGTP